MDEIDVAKLAVGQRAEITFDALRDSVFQGQVAAISPSGTAQQGVVTYPVSIDMEVPADVTIPAGLTANAKVLIRQKPDVLAVPSRAVRRQDEDQVVDVVVDGGTETRIIHVGLTNEQLSEVLDGLSEGEAVVVPTTSAGSARSTSRTSSR